MVALDRTIRIDNDDIYQRLDIAMLETIVHNYQICLRELLLDTMNCESSLFAHHNRYVWVLALDLQRLITHLTVGVIYLDNAIALSDTAISAR